MLQLIQNAIYVPSQRRIVNSVHVHDFQEVTFDDGKVFYIDGGTDYSRRGGNFELLKDGRIVDLSLNAGDEFSTKIVHNLLWGTRGVDGKSPILTYKRIKDLTFSHQRNILLNCPNASPVHRLTLLYWITKGEEYHTSFQQLVHPAVSQVMPEISLQDLFDYDRGVGTARTCISGIMPFKQ